MALNGIYKFKPTTRRQTRTALCVRRRRRRLQQQQQQLHVIACLLSRFAKVSRLLITCAIISQRGDSRSPRRPLAFSPFLVISAHFPQPARTHARTHVGLKTPVHFASLIARAINPRRGVNGLREPVIVDNKAVSVRIGDESRLSRIIGRSPRIAAFTLLVCAR